MSEEGGEQPANSSDVTPTPAANASSDSLAAPGEEVGRNRSRSWLSSGRPSYRKSMGAPKKSATTSFSFLAPSPSTKRSRRLSMGSAALQRPTSQATAAEEQDQRTAVCGDDMTQGGQSGASARDDRERGGPSSPRNAPEAVSVDIGSGATDLGESSTESLEVGEVSVVIVEQEHRESEAAAVIDVIEDRQDAEDTTNHEQRRGEAKQSEDVRESCAIGQPTSPECAEGKPNDAWNEGDSPMGRVPADACIPRLSEAPGEDECIADAKDKAVSSSVEPSDGENVDEDGTASVEASSCKQPAPAVTISVSEPAVRREEVDGNVSTSSTRRESEPLKPSSVVPSLQLQPASDSPSGRASPGASCHTGWRASPMPKSPRGNIILRGGDSRSLISNARPPPATLSEGEPSSERCDSTASKLQSKEVGAEEVGGSTLATEEKPAAERAFEGKPGAGLALSKLQSAPVLRRQDSISEIHDTVTVVDSYLKEMGVEGITQDEAKILMKTLAMTGGDVNALDADQITSLLQQVAQPSRARGKAMSRSASRKRKRRTMMVTSSRLSEQVEPIKLVHSDEKSTEVDSKLSPLSGEGEMTVKGGEEAARDDSLPVAPTLEVTPAEPAEERIVPDGEKKKKRKKKEKKKRKKRAEMKRYTEDDLGMYSAGSLITIIMRIQESADREMSRLERHRSKAKESISRLRSKLSAAELEFLGARDEFQKLSQELGVELSSKTSELAQQSEENARLLAHRDQLEQELEQYRDNSFTIELEKQLAQERMMRDDADKAKESAEEEAKRLLQRIAEMKLAERQLSNRSRDAESESSNALTRGRQGDADGDPSSQVIQDLRAAQSDAQEQIASLKAKLQQTKDALAESKEKALKASGQIVLVRADVSRKDAEVFKLKRALSESEAKFTKHNTKLTSERDRLQAQLTAMRSHSDSAAASASKTIRELNERALGLESEKLSLERSVRRLSTSVQQLERANEALTTHGASLSLRLEELRTELFDKETEARELQSRVALIEHENETLKKQVVTLERALDTALAAAENVRVVQQLKEQEEQRRLLEQQRTLEERERRLEEEEKNRIEAEKRRLAEESRREEELERQREEERKREDEERRRLAELRELEEQERKRKEEEWMDERKRKEEEWQKEEEERKRKEEEWEREETERKRKEMEWEREEQERKRREQQREDEERLWQEKERQRLELEAESIRLEEELRQKEEALKRVEEEKSRSAKLLQARDSDAGPLQLEENGDGGAQASAGAQTEESHTSVDVPAAPLPPRVPPPPSAPLVSTTDRKLKLGVRSAASEAALGAQDKEAPSSMPCFSNLLSQIREGSNPLRKVDADQIRKEREQAKLKGNMEQPSNIMHLIARVLVDRRVHIGNEGSDEDDEGSYSDYSEDDFSDDDDDSEEEDEDESDDDDY